jgi:O-antigen/teichoic acid export membrane protein
VPIYGLRHLTWQRSHLTLLKECLVGFSLWSHTIGVLTDLVYRADLLILGWLNVPLRAVGNYNIALQMTSLARVVPQLLQSNTMLGLSRTANQERRHDLTFAFMKYSFLVSIMTLGCYLLFGRWIVSLFAGRDVEEIFGLGTYILAGLCLYSTLRPLISYAVAVHDIRQCLVYAILPGTVATLACYVAMGYADGAPGMAVANLAGGAIMAAFTLAYMSSRTSFRWRFTWITPQERTLSALLTVGARRWLNRQ